MQLWGKFGFYQCFFCSLYCIYIHVNEHLHIKTLTCVVVPNVLALLIATLGICSRCQFFKFANLALKSHFQFLTTNSTSFELLCPCGDY